MAEIPFNRATVAPRQVEYVEQAMRSGHLSGDGSFTQSVSELLEQWIGAERVLLTTSCTHALELSALLLGCGPGTEVVVPSFTFVSTANAFALLGATPVFVDVDPLTLNIDAEQVAAALGPTTRAVVPVHYGGVGCDVDRLVPLCADAGVALVEDNAHGLVGTVDGRPLGSFGALATLSFHETKNFTSGEGGALILNDPSLTERAEIIREKGTNRSRFFRGQVDKYTWVDLGSSYLPSEVLAAMLLAQLEYADTIQARREAAWTAYHNALRPWAEQSGATLPEVPENRHHPAHLFWILFENLDVRTRFLKHCRANGVHSVFHYLPLHLSPMGERFGGRPGMCPVTESVVDRLARLPLFSDIRQDEVDRVIEVVTAFEP